MIFLHIFHIFHGIFPWHFSDFSGERALQQDEPRAATIKVISPSAKVPWCFWRKGSWVAIWWSEKICDFWRNCYMKIFAFLTFLAFQWFSIYSIPAVPLKLWLSLLKTIENPTLLACQLMSAYVSLCQLLALRMWLAWSFFFKRAYRFHHVPIGVSAGKHR